MNTAFKIAAAVIMVASAAMVYTGLHFAPNAVVDSMAATALFAAICGASAARLLNFRKG